MTLQGEPLIVHRRRPEKVARTAALATAATAVLCGVCCVLPFALPAVAAAMSGGVLAWIGRGHTWATRIATVVVIATWAWIAWTSVRTKKRPARSTVLAMIIATVVLVLAIVWPRIEPSIIRRLRGTVDSSTATPGPPRSVTTAQAVVELIATPADTSNGERWVGLHFQLTPGWHIYWRNPGDSGSAPTVKWNVSSGTVGAFEWPTPQRLPVGPLMNYGYEGEVTLPARLRMNGAATTSDRVEAAVHWVVCADVCVPGKAELAVLLSDTETSPAREEWAASITRALALVPTPMPTTWRATATSERGQFLLSITTDQSRASPVFFPLDESQVEDGAPQAVSIHAREIRLGLKKSAQLTNDPAQLRGVVTFGPGPGVVVSAQVTTSRLR